MKWIYVIVTMYLVFTSRVYAEDSLKIGGAARINYTYQDYSEESKKRGGELEFELFRIKVEAEYQGVRLYSQYRWYSSFDFPEYAYFEYDVAENSKVQLGLNKVPFGVLPYSSYGYWESLLYHIGLEDDNDLGIKYIYEADQWNFQAAFYKNAELAASKKSRYSFDLVTDPAQNANNVENNQLNLRLEKSLPSFKYGASLQYGQLYNKAGNDNGYHNAYEVHFEYDNTDWGVQFELGGYTYAPENLESEDPSQVLFGAFNTSFFVASEADFILLNGYKSIIKNGKLIDTLNCYNNFAYLKPREKTSKVGNATWQNTLGCSIVKGPLVTYAELISGKNSSFVNGSGVGLLDDHGWSSRVNINVGYYF